MSAPGGRQRAPFPKQPVPDYVNWDRWVGPAPMSPFHEEKLVRDNHENISNFSLGMISCWGIHHLDIAQWGNGADRTGPTAIVGEGSFPKEGGFDAIVSWKVRFEYAGATPITFVSDGTPGFRHGIRFVGDAGWVHVLRGVIESSDERLLRDPENKCGVMPIKLPVSNRHTYNFVEAVKSNGSVICDVETAVRSDTLCQLALIAVKRGRKIQWDPTAERLVADDEAAALLQPRAFRGPWKLPAQ